MTQPFSNRYNQHHIIVSFFSATNIHCSEVQHLKTILRIVGLLVILNSALIYMHYSKLADARESTEKESWYNQEIEVINRTDALFIRHHFHNLDGDRYEIVLPAESRNRACFLETDSSCIRINENVSAILEGEQSRQSITYEIPKTETFGKSKLFREPFASLRNARPSSTILHVTDESGVGGMWISGLDLVGSKSMEMVDYSMYKGNGRVSDLYWQRKVSPQVYRGDRLSIYGDPIDLDVAEQLNSSLLELNARHMDIVIDSESKPLETSRIVITTNSALGLSDLVLDRGVRSLYAISEKDKLVSGLIASIFMDTPSGASKPKGLYETLVNSMTTDQFETLKKLLADKQGEHLDAAAIDKLIGEVFGLKTSFVEKNKEGSYPISVGGH